MALLPTIYDMTKHLEGGGQVASAYNSLTNQALNQRKQQLENQYYGPNIESQIANREALTQGQNIHNQYLPEELRLANALNQQKFEWNPANWKAENDYRNANTAETMQMLPYKLNEKKLANLKALMEYTRQKQFEDKFNNFVKQNGPVNTSPLNQNSMNQNLPVNTTLPVIDQNPVNQNLPVNTLNQNSSNQNIPVNITPINTNTLNQNPVIANTPVNTNHQPANPNEQVISPGSPQLSGINEWYENNPMDRPELEKRGFKKVQQIKIDKTGKATLITKYPDGKITVTSMNANDKDGNGIPLTNKMISQHQNVVASVDVAVPVLDKIIDMKNSEYSTFGGWSNKGAKYAAVVSQALDSLLGAFGLPQTNEGIKTIREQLEIGRFEGPVEYRNRIKELKEDILKRQKYSEGLVKKAIKINENDNENDPYGLKSFDLSGE